MGMLQDQVIIITGSSSGIGLATATAALEEGAKVLGADIGTPPPILAHHANFSFIQCNVSDQSADKRIVEACRKAYGGRVDALLNIAGVCDFFASADSFSDEVWDLCMGVNLVGPVKLMREVLPIMKAQKSGSIVNVASKAGTSGAVGGIAYTASKHGLIGATKNVAWRFKGDNIRCNAVCPGGVTSYTNVMDTNILDMEVIDKEGMKVAEPILAAHSPEKAPYITPEEVAHSLIFLASSHSNRINGAIIPLDNAWSTI